MRPEGIRRLSILLGTLGSIGWIIFVFISSNGYSGLLTFSVGLWLIVIAGIPICFFALFGLVRGIAWVVEGFIRDKK